MMNLARVHEAIAEVVPERDCIVHRGRHFSWSEVTDRTRRLGHLLRAHGLGFRRARADLKGWESGQDHVALYLHNGPEYLEGMLGAYKARCAPFNVNYRYVEEELTYLFENAEAKAVIYHAAFAPLLEKVRSRIPKMSLLLQVADGSNETLLDGALDYETALATSSAEPMPDDLSGDDLYILYTGGTTGLPKGVLWRQDDIFHAALMTGEPASLSEVCENVKRREGLRVLPAPPFMHGAAHWAAFNLWNLGGTVLIQDEVERLDPRDVWLTCERERAQMLTIVGDAFARPLIDELRRNPYDLSDLFIITSGGAILTASLKQELLELLPNVRIRDALGSSESGAQGAHVSTKETGAVTGEFDLVEDNVVLSEDFSRVLEPGDSERGWLARMGRMPLGYFKDEEKTRRTFPEVDGVRYAVPGDRAEIAADGRLKLLGRDSVTINSGGEKIFAEEVELALKHHAGIYDCVVCGTPSERWGSAVTALVQLRPGAQVSEAELSACANERITRYKLPKHYIFVDSVVRAPSGKADYRWAKQTATKALGLDS